MHTSVSGIPFEAALPIGSYTLTVERGKEYLPYSRMVTVDGTAKINVVKLRRFADMAKRGWYSGDTMCIGHWKNSPRPCWLKT